MADTTRRRLDPVVPITDSRFKYTPSAQSDIRDTFRRVRAAQAALTATSPAQPTWLHRVVRGAK